MACGGNIDAIQGLADYTAAGGGSKMKAAIRRTGHSRWVGCGVCIQSAAQGRYCGDNQGAATGHLLPLQVPLTVQPQTNRSRSTSGTDGPGPDVRPSAGFFPARRVDLRDGRLDVLGVAPRLGNRV